MNLSGRLLVAVRRTACVILLTRQDALSRAEEHRPRALFPRWDGPRGRSWLRTHTRVVTLSSREDTIMWKWEYSRVSRYPKASSPDHPS